MATHSFTLTSDATLVPPVSFTLTSDAILIPANQMIFPSDAILGTGTNQINLTSDAFIQAAQPAPPPSGGDVPFPPVKQPLAPPLCTNVNDCFPCFVLPTTNTSAEAADQILAFSLNWGSLQNNTPPIGFNFRSNGCVQVCESSVSQTEADLCAARQQTLCVNTPAPPQPPPPCISPPCSPPVTPPPSDPPPIFISNSASCIVHCADGLPFTFTIPAGQFVARSQVQADREAASFACREASIHKICLAISSTSVCLSQSSPMTFVAAGSFLDANANFWELRSGSLPPGYSFGSTVTGPTLTIQGTPTKAGNYSFNIRVTAPNGDFMEKNFTVTVAGITTADPLPNAIFNQAYSETLTADGFSAPVSWRIISGSLPNGLSLNEDTGEISGTADATPKGYAFTVAADLATRSCTKQFHLTLQGSFPNITPDILSNTPSKFADTVAAGTYRVGYVNGALKYNPAQDWALNNPFNSNGFRITYLLMGVPTTITFPGTNTSFATQAQCEAANNGITQNIVHSGGGPISMYLDDTPNWGDNVAGSPNPTFSLVTM